MLRSLINFWDNTSFYLDRKVFYAGYGIAALFILSFFIPPLQTIAVFLLLAILVVVLIDSILLYQKRGLYAERIIGRRLSNGDNNKIVLRIENDYHYKVVCTVIEELPM